MKEEKEFMRTQEEISTSKKRSKEEREKKSWSTKELLGLGSKAEAQNVKLGSHLRPFNLYLMQSAFHTISIAQITWLSSRQSTVK